MISKLKFSQAKSILENNGLKLIKEAASSKGYTVTIGDQIGFEEDGADEDFESSMESQFGKDFEIDGISFEYDYIEHDNEDIYLVWKATGSKRDVKTAANKLFKKIKPVWERERDSHELWEKNQIYLDIESDEFSSDWGATKSKVTGLVVTVCSERNDLDEDEINRLFDKIRGNRVTYSDKSLNDRMIVVPQEIVPGSFKFDSVIYPVEFKIECSAYIPEKLLLGPSGLYLSDKFYSTSINNIFDDFAKGYFRKAFSDHELDIRASFDHTAY